MLEFRTLGTVDLRDATGDGRQLRSVLAQTKRLALLGRLAVSRPPGPVSRDVLLALFWPESTEDRARNALNQAVFTLRRSLGPGVLLTHGGGSLEIDPARLQCDAREFEELLDAGEIETAASIYRDPLLPGLHLSECPDFERWLDGERLRLRDRALRAILGLAEQAREAGNTLGAVRWLERARELAPHDEELLVQLVLRLSDLGDRVGAVRAFERYRRVLSHELGLEPSPETVELVRALRKASRPEGRAFPSSREEWPVSSATARGADLKRESRLTESGDGAQRMTGNGDSVPRWSLAAAILLATAAGVLFTFSLWHAEPGSSAEVRIEARRVVVAGLVNRTADPSLDPIGQMAADWISRELTRTGGAEVIPLSLLGEGPLPSGRESSVDETAGPGDPLSVARRAGAGLLVRGSYASSEDVLVLEAGIVDVPTGRLVRGIRGIEAPVEDPLAGVRELRRQVAGALATLLDPRLEMWSGAASQPPSLEAYALFAEGLDRYAALEFAEAREHFLRAASLDSSFTSPVLWAMQLPSLGNDEIDALGRQLLERRHRLPSWDRGMLDYRLALARGELDRAYRAILQVAGLVPRSHWWFEATELALRLGRPAEALEHLERAGTAIADPAAPGRYWRLETAALHRLGRYGDELRSARTWNERFPGQGVRAELRALAGLGRADAVTRRTTELLWAREPGGGSTGLALDLADELRVHGHPAAGQGILELSLHRWAALPRSADRSDPSLIPYGRTLAAAGRLVEARDVFGRLLDLGVKPEVVRGELGLLAARAGERREAERLAGWFSEASDREAPYGGGWYKQWEARIVAGLGERERTVRLLRQAYSRGWSRLLADHRSRDWELVRDYRPFVELVSPSRGSSP